MFLIGLGGGTQTSCAGRQNGRQGLFPPPRCARWRVRSNGHRKWSFIFCGGQHATPSAPSLSRHAFTLAGEAAAVPGTDARSADLNDMCTLQLGMLYQLLSRAGTNYSSMRCTVYARNFTAVGPGQVKLVRVAQFPVGPGQGHDFQISQQQLLLHTEQSWALQGGSAAVDPSAMIEDCLLHREVVALPSSSSLVFPLVDCGVLVGLLVVEMEADRMRQDAGQAGVMAAALPPALCSQAGPEGSPHAAGSVEGCRDSAVAAMAPVEYGTRQVPARLHRSLTDEELQCLRLAVPLLAKACGMDARTSWQLAQSSVTAAAARGLLREAQRPLSTLNTFGKMLVPRLKDGDPDKDMANGILVQGKRLQDLMWQLEDALHGPGGAGGFGGFLGASAGAAPSSTRSMSVAVPAVGLPGAPALPPPPFRSPSALPRDPSPAVQELLSLPQPRPAALPIASQQPAPHRPPDAGFGSFASVSSMDPPLEGSLHYRSLEAGVGPSELESASPLFVSGSRGPPPVLPGRVTFVERSSTSPAPPQGAPPATGDAARVTDAFTIRQPPRYAPSSSGGGPAAGPSLRSGGRGSVASSATIDVEMDDCGASRSRGSGASKGATLAVADRSQQPAGGAVVWGQVHLSGGGGVGAGSGTLASDVSTNLASALAGVLTAAYRLAAVSGIGFIVNSPLSAVLPRRTATASAAASRPHMGPAALTSTADDCAAAAGAARKPRQHEQQQHAVSNAGAVPAVGPRLIPRPARPLLVGVPAALVHRVVGYMVDIALQCTPRGGQVCVSARQDGGGVQVQVLHSGRLDLQRLHVRSQSMQHQHSHQPAAHPPRASVAAAPAGSLSSVAAAAHNAGGGVAVAVATRPAVGSTPAAAPPAAGSSGSGPHVGSGVLSVEMAQELAQQAGGHLTVSYPYNMVNARSGSLDVGTSVEIWLPGPAAAAAHN